MIDDNSRVVRPRQDEAQDAALPPEFMRLCELLGQFDAEIRRALDPQELRLLELRWELGAPSGGPTPTLEQTAAMLKVRVGRLRALEQELLKTLPRRLRRSSGGDLVSEVRQAAEGWSERLGNPETGAVLDAFAAAGGRRPLLRLVSVVLGGVGSPSIWAERQDRFERVAVRLLARRGPLPTDEPARAVLEALPSEEVGERLDAILRVRLLAPAVRQADGRLALPELVPARSSFERGLQAEERQDRRMQALIGPLEQHDSATVPQLLEALAVRLPAGDLPSVEGARWLLRKRSEAFTCVARGRYALVDGAADALLLDRRKADSP